jgi:hypothetical protein
MSAPVGPAPAGTTLSVADVLAIQQTLARFSHLYDNLVEERLDLLFTPDVVVEIGVGAGRTVRGIDRARAFREELGPRSPDHQTVDTVVQVDPDGTVRARSRYLAVLADGSVTNGDYLDVLVRTEVGWRISHRRTVPRYPGPAGGPGRQPHDPQTLAPWRIGAGTAPL